MSELAISNYEELLAKRMQGKIFEDEGYWFLEEPEVPIEIIKDALLECPVEYIKQETMFLYEELAQIIHNLEEGHAGWCGCNIDYVSTSRDQLEYLLEEVEQYFSFTE